jgi:hypothetical protein
MGLSESSSQSSRVPRICGRASEVRSGARSARPTWESSALTARRSKTNKRLPIFLAAQTGRTHWPHTPQWATRGAPRGRQSRPWRRTWEARGAECLVCSSRWAGVRMRWCRCRLGAGGAGGAGWRQFGSKLEVGWRRGFHRYERAGERHERTHAVGLGFGGRACIRLSERVYSRRQTSGLAR